MFKGLEIPLPQGGSILSSYVCRKIIGSTFTYVCRQIMTMHGNWQALAVQSLSLVKLTLKQFFELLS